jgi:hypothetical protein
MNLQLEGKRALVTGSTAATPSLNSWLNALLAGAGIVILLSMAMHSLPNLALVLANLPSLWWAGSSQPYSPAFNLLVLPTLALRFANFRGPADATNQLETSVCRRYMSWDQTARRPPLMKCRTRAITAMMSRR